MTIGERIKQQRKYRNMTMEEVARKMGMTKGAIYKYEKGVVTNIPAHTLDKLAEVLECTPSYLMGWAEPELSDDMDNEATIRMLVTNSAKLSHERRADCMKLLRYMYPELFDNRAE